MNDPQLTEKIMGIDLRNAMRLGDSEGYDLLSPQ